MANEKNVKNEKIAKLLEKTLDFSTLYDTEKNLNNGKTYIKVNENGYKKLTDFFFNQENINAYKINSYYIERLNDIKKVYNEQIEKNGVLIERNHYYFKKIASDTLEYELFKTVLDM